VEGNDVGKFCTAASRLTISGGWRSRRSLRSFRSVQEFSAANCRGRRWPGRVRITK